MGRASTTAGADVGLAHIAAAPVHPSIADLIECTKPGITRLVTITALVGFILAAVGRPWHPLELLVVLAGCLLGTAFSAAGANALNQWSERARDACMERTAGRPIPSGRVSPATALRLGAGLSIVGVVGLGLACGLAPALISAACILTYLLIYTPMKATSPLSTLIGAVPGALPPLIGWYAVWASHGPAVGHAGGLALFALMFVWQMPHFMAIAWKYRREYAAGGYRVASVGDESGAKTSAVMLRWTLLLLPATLLPAAAMPGTLGAATIIAATVSGLGFLWLVLEFCRDRSERRAKAVFLASIAHLPLLLMVMVADAGFHALLG